MNVPEYIERRLPLRRLSSWAVVGGGCGLVAEIHPLPSALRALTLVVFIMVGPGSVVIEWVSGLPLTAVRALVPVTGLSIVLLVVSLFLLMGLWSPRLVLLGLALVTLGLGLENRRRDALVERVSA